MARLLTSGAEIEAGTPNFSTGGPDGDANAGPLTRDTTTFRSGAASFKHDSLANQNSPTSFGGVALITYVDGRTYYFRAYVLCASAPSTASKIMQYGFATTEPAVRMRTDGGIELMGANAVSGSPSASICDGTWHRIELSATATATGNWTAAELRLDGISVATWTGTQARNTGIIRGWGTAPGAGKVIYFDDLAVNDSAGAANNSWPGDGKVVLLKPTADSAKGTGWTDDNASTASLFPSVDNTPPTGIADTTAGGGGHQVRNATSNANSNYDAAMTTYTAAGIGAADTVNVVQCWVATTAPVVTSAKLGTVGIVSNPAVANIALAAAGTAGAFWSGTAGGTYAVGWKWSPGTLADAPIVTKSTAPIMRITQVTASTRIADVCAMFVYVDYSPAAAPAVKKPSAYKSPVAMMRAATR